MFELFTWIQLKDLGITIYYFKRYSTFMLSLLFIFSTSITLLAFYVCPYQYFYQYNHFNFFLTKLIVETINIFTSLPYLLIQSIKNKVIADQKIEDRYKISTFLKSKILERGLISYLGIFYLVSGLFNVVFAVVMIREVDIWKPGTLKTIGFVYCFADILSACLGAAVIFIFFLFKLIGVYYAYVKSGRIVKKKITLK